MIPHPSSRVERGQGSDLLPQTHPTPEEDFLPEGAKGHGGLNNIGQRASRSDIYAVANN